MLVFDVMSKDSFDHVEKWLNRVNKYGGTDMQVRPLSSSFPPLCLIPLIPFPPIFLRAFVSALVDADYKS